MIASSIKSLSDRLIEAQAPIRILDAIKWDDGVQRRFFAAHGRRQPDVGVDYYRKNPLGFDPDALLQKFAILDQDIVSNLGEEHEAGVLMRRMCAEYALVIRMLQGRGTPEFPAISQRLFGKSTDPFHKNGPTPRDLGKLLNDSLRNIDEGMFLEKERKNIATPEAVKWLQNRLDGVFSDPHRRVQVIESDGIVADAAAGSDYIKLRKDARFSERDLRGLEAHEGWVHVGTTLNGQMQPVCGFLAKGTPSATITQEGLAVFIEVVSFNSHPARLRRIVDRIRAIHMAEQGATFVDVYAELRHDGRNTEEAYTTAMRVFRGSTPEDEPFTKDLAYSKGFVLVYNFIRLAVRHGRLDLIPLLFCGKLALEDMGAITRLVDKGLVRRPVYLPPPLQDLNALTAWMVYSNFLNRIDLSQIETELEPIFS